VLAMIVSWGVRHTGSAPVLVPRAFSLFMATVFLRVGFTAHEPVRAGTVPCCIYIELKDCVGDVGAVHRRRRKAAVDNGL
jgi:hypothetical protein